MDFAKECKQESKMLKGIRMTPNPSLGGTIFDIIFLRFYEPKMSWFLMIKWAQFLLTINSSTAAQQWNFRAPTAVMLVPG
ncbi:MAG: hypothetical protein KGD67_13055, partial [Candidatus Lokiarchaeota archaeon]|nr:hypothetical protein [Candidatus Lokiarchaeota archaeon]